MGWNEEKVKSANRGMGTSSKILLLLIGCILLIIMVLIVILMNTGEEEYFKVYIDEEKASITQEELFASVNEVIYINVENFAKLVGYEYHKGEYKASIIEEDKCYVQGKDETTSFYSNENKIYKLMVGKLDGQYAEYTMENSTQIINEKMYIPLEAVPKAFNVLISATDKELQIYTLDNLIKSYDVAVQEWGYSTISEQSYENKKAILYGCLIVKKQSTETEESNGLYKVINIDNTKEILLDRYKSIEFSEKMQGFYVTDTSSKVGIINLDGTSKIEIMYDSIELLDDKSGLYIVELDKKYGVVTDEGGSVVYPEYDSIGVTANIIENRYLILDELIPVCKEKKWGAFDKSGKLVLPIIYDEIGYLSTSIEIDGIKELVKPIISIEKAKGVIVKKTGKYGLLDIKGKEMVPVVVDGIYAVNGAKDEYSRYFMLYNGEELNVIERLIKAGYIREEDKDVENGTIESENDNSVDNNVNQ